MKILLLCLSVFSLFHAWCCWAGSYTGKPAFRAHFASTGDWRHITLILAGSSLVAFLSITGGWACGIFSSFAGQTAYSPIAPRCVTFICLMAWLAILLNSFTSWNLARQEPKLAERARRNAILRACGVSVLLVASVGGFYQFMIHRLERLLTPENGVLTHWRAMHLASGVSPLLPVFFILVGFYASFWITLHGLALLGPDRPCLPRKETLMLEFGKEKKEYLRMFSQEDGAARIEQVCQPLDWKVLVRTFCLLFLFRVIAWRLADGVPIRSLGAETYCVVFLFWLGLSYSLMLAETWRLYEAWEALRRLLTFLDRLPLRRTLAVLHGFSWGSVWKMSGNVLEVRYKVISRQLECMNHTIATLDDFIATKPSDPDYDVAKAAQNSHQALVCMQNEGRVFADWYTNSFTKTRAGNLTSFQDFQSSVAAATGTILADLLVPAWKKEKNSLIVAPIEDHDPNEERKQKAPPQANEAYIRNAEEFVCLTYLGFIQNILGRLRTIAMTIAALFIASTVALSTYPFDPRQILSLVLIILFVAVGGVIVKVYAEMHRDTTLSHVTNTKPGELGSEFWIKILGFGFAPLIGLLTRIIPGIGDFLFSWLQPGISALK